MKKLVLSVANLALCSLLIACPAMAEEAKRGAVTNLPIPRFVSLKASKGNVRRGPSLTHRIDWILLDSLIKARLDRNVLAWVNACEPEWCEISADGYKGWAQKSALWGVSVDEVFE